MVGQTISHYRILEKLGEGGMGVVWKARDTRLERWVALKALPADYVADDNKRARFLREARAASALSHPGIITIYDFLEADGAYFLVMEYVEGKPLDRVIPRKGMRLAELLPIAIQIASALGAAHKAGIVHRDVKPGNVIISTSGAAKVLDFGLAKQVTTELPGSDSTQTAALTEEGIIAGTPAYMSPEQAQAKSVDARTDIFSFGAMLYEMATGQSPFQRDSKVSTLAAVIKDEPAALEGLPRDLSRLISRCLRKSPERRQQSMFDIALSLEELKEDSESGVFAATGTGSRDTRSRAWLAIPVVLAILAGAWLWLAKRGLPPERSAASFDPKPLTSYAGSETHPTLSPDGTQVAFSWDGPNRDNLDIYIRLVAGGAPLRVTTDRAKDLAPAWSPDGTAIAFVRVVGDSNIVRVVSPLGGQERAVAETATPSSNHDAWLTWTPDAKRLIFTQRPETRAFASLVSVDLSTGESKPFLPLPPGRFADRLVTFSPDGSRFAFVRYENAQTGDVYVSSEGGALRRLTNSGAPASGLAWTAPGDEIVYFAADALHRLAVDREGAQPHRITAIQRASGLSISSRGRLVYALEAYDTNLYRLNLNTPSTPLQAVASTRRDESAQISPDGDRIAFASDRSGAMEIWVARADGSQQTQLTTLGGASHSPSFSPDGKRIAFASLTSGNRDIYVIDSPGYICDRFARRKA